MVASVIERSEVNQADLNSVLNPKHYRELVHKRGLNPDWVRANCKSVDAKTASEHLGYKAYSPGILLTSHGYQIQFRPDVRWPNKEGKKAKYLTPKDEDSYDVMLPRHPEDPRYWDDIEALKSRCYQINGNPCLVLTEGLFKAISLTSHGIPTVAILGVEQGLTSRKRDPQGRRYLVPGLERFEKEGFGFIIGFDADGVRKKGVIMAEYSLGFQLLLFNSPLYSITGLWHEQHESGKSQKGIDDYIQLNGYEKFNREVLSKAETFEEWKEKHLDVLNRQFDQSAKKPPTPVEIAKEIAEDYAEQLAFNNETHYWMRYEAENKGVWSPETNDFIESIVFTILESKAVKYGNPNYVTNVVKALKQNDKIIKRKWLERSSSEILPFQNGVLEIATGKLLEHSPENYLTWVLPREHNPLAKDWSKIDAWLDQISQESPVLKQIFICFAKAVLTGRSDLQKFLHLIGTGGSGKGTYIRLITDLIGINNVCSSDFPRFCSNRFETVDAYRKRLLIFADERQVPKNISNFMKVTGGDLIRAEQKNKPAFSFQFQGMILVASEKPIFQGQKGYIKSGRIPIVNSLHLTTSDIHSHPGQFQDASSAPDSDELSLLQVDLKFPNSDWQLLR